MTQEIKKQDWERFFNKISCDFLDWEATLRIVVDGTVPGVLSDGLTFEGIRYDGESGHDHMEVAIGGDVSAHKKHNIPHPLNVTYEPAKRGSCGTLDIEDATGTKTRIEFHRPTHMVVEYVRSEYLRDR